MKWLIGLCLVLTACGKSGANSAASQKAVADPKTFIGVWDSTNQNFCDDSGCGLVSAPQECVGVQFPPWGAFQIQSLDRGGWDLDMENISIVGSTIHFETTNYTIDMAVQKSQDMALVTFAKGCQKQFKFIGGDDGGAQ